MLTYTYTLANDGDVALTNVTLSDASAPGLSAAVLSGLTDTDGDGLADDLAVGTVATATYRYTAMAGDGGTVLTSVATAATTETAARSATLTQMAANPAPVVNTPPEAVDDRVATGYGAPLALDAADLLANDGDADGDPLSVVGVRALGGGSVTRTGDAIVFTPAAGFEGTATFEYSVSDGMALSTATVSVAVASSGYSASLLAMVSEGAGLADPSLAVGLAGFSYWKSPPFLNLMKQAAVPGIRNSAGDQVALDELVTGGYLDENGYPVRMYEGNETLPGWQQGYDIYVSIHHENDSVRQETSGDYVVEWTGAGTIQLRDFDVTSQETYTAADGTVTGGRMTGTWAFEDVLKMVKILDTDPNGTGNYIRDISIVRAEYKDMYDAGAIFDPRYTALIEDHHTLRFMDWMRTNGSDVKSLDDVASMDSLTWAGSVNAGRRRRSRARAFSPCRARSLSRRWCDSPTRSGRIPGSTFRSRPMTITSAPLPLTSRSNLDDGLVAKFELSNEVWNWAGGFEQVREASLLGSDGATSTSIRDARDYYGYRSAEIRAILDAEMSRVDAEMILGTQTVYYRHRRNGRRRGEPVLRRQGNFRPDVGRLRFAGRDRVFQ